MTPKQYLKAKNKIVKRVTGVTLVPKKQRKNVEFKELTSALVSMEASCAMLGSNICTYCCVYYRSGSYYNECNGCPMKEAGNKCEPREGTSTWARANTLWVADATSDDIRELAELVEQYNKEKGTKS